ncbi:MAG: ATP-dependent DNA ligase [Methanosarcinaceae archaeon]|nr:ATP-dependent DNA ligase [Methanosarcinaceae archaeon]
MESFRKIAELYSEIEDITSHKKIVETLASFLRDLEPEDVRVAAYLALGTAGPKFEDIDLGIGEKLGVKAISATYEIPEEIVEEKYSTLGDLGDVAAGLCRRRRSSLDMKDVFEQMVKIRDASGKGSQNEKVLFLSRLLGRSTPDEAKYIIRIALGQLRLGFGEQFLIEALAIAFTGDRKNARRIDDTYNICTDIGQLAQSLAEHGVSSLGRFSIKPGRPVQMMLAKRIDNFEELEEKFPGEMAAEEKYDGERVQIHVDGDRIRAFSRRLKDISDQFPDVIEEVHKTVKVQKMVLDGEIVAFANERIQPFQDLMQRRRKHDIEEYIEKVPVAVFFFDLIYLDGRSLLKKPYYERRALLEKSLEKSDSIRFSRRIVSSDLNKIEDFFNKCVEKGLEGIIVKSLDEGSIYQPGKRGWLWVKWKKEYVKGVRETFDLVIVGSYYGKGKRKVSFGALLCAALNKNENRYETFTKVGTGFNDDDFEEINELLDKHFVDKVPANVLIEKDMQPDRYIEPSVVIEVLGSQITASPGHTAGKNKGDKGLALRFPRFLRIRYDKGPAEATTVEEIRGMR